VLYEKPLHPYTKLLLAAIPLPVPERKRTSISISEIGRQAPSGCPFQGRCPLADGFCCREIPPLEEKAPGHFAACFKS
jgi:oligopeptide/dipeptide ABC transporter ATP-binding protein